MSLCNKHRQTTLNGIVGNESTKKKIEKFLAMEDKPQAFILEGMTGCGKTTIARIIASEYGASELSITEINGSDNNGVDDARSLSELSQMMPMDAEHQVFIIDEAHNATRKFWDCLLKVIEEPPSHSTFIFCTTELAKIPSNIKNRCQILNVSPLEPKELGPLLTSICKKEKKTVEKIVLKEIIKKSGGSVRNGLTLLESVIHFPTAEGMIESLSSYDVVAETEEFKKLCYSLANKDPWATVSKHLKTIKMKPEEVRYKVLAWMGGCLLNQSSFGWDHLNDVIGFFSDSFVESGKAGLISACYDCSSS